MSTQIQFVSTYTCIRGSLRASVTTARHPANATASLSTYFCNARTTASQAPAYRYIHISNNNKFVFKISNHNRIMLRKIKIISNNKFNDGRYKNYLSKSNLMIFMIDRKHMNSRAAPLRYCFTTRGPL